MDFIKRKLSVKKQAADPTEVATSDQRVEKNNDDSEYIRSQDGTYSRSRSASKSSKRQQPIRAPGSFVKYGGPGINAPGNVKHDANGNAYGFSASDVPPVPQNAHLHGDAAISDFERYRLQTLSKDPVHEGPAPETEEMLERKGVRFE